MIQFKPKAAAFYHPFSDVVKKPLKVVDGGGELRIMRHSFAGA
jgi:hypothetical protein